MIEEIAAIVYISSKTNRRFFTLDGAVAAEAKAMLRKKYPSEETEHDDMGRITYGGFHWSSIDNADEIYSRLCRYIKFKAKRDIKRGC